MTEETGLISPSASGEGQKPTERSGLLKREEVVDGPESQLWRKVIVGTLFILLLLLGCIGLALSASDSTPLPPASDAGVVADDEELSVVPQVSLTINTDYGLAVDVTIKGPDDAKIDFEYYRMNGQGSTLTRTIYYVGGPNPQGTKATLVHFAAETLYTVTASVNGDVIHKTNLLTMLAIAGPLTFNTRDYLVSLTGNFSAGVIVCDRGLDLVFAFDNLGDIVYVNDQCSGASPKVPYRDPKSESLDATFTCLGTDFAVDNLYIRETDILGMEILHQTQSQSTHEVSLSADPERPILSTSYFEQDGIIGNVIQAWDMQSETPDTIINLFDHLDPATDWGSMSKTSDWLHVNSVQEGSQGNILVSARHLSAVLSFDDTTYELQWVLASQMVGTVVFADMKDRFYNQHHVQQLENDNILMFDNGNDRPIEYGNFTRAAEYELDFSVSPPTATLVYEYRLGERGNHAGSVNRLPNGNTHVSRACQPTEDCSMWVYEGDPEGVQVAVAVLPLPSAVAPTAYRCEGWESINGERRGY